MARPLILFVATAFTTPSLAASTHVVGQADKSAQWQIKTRTSGTQPDGAHRAQSAHSRDASPGTVVFSNDQYPQCCTSAFPGQPCFFRIPVVLAIPNSSVVLAFAEMRGGAAGWGCADGAGPAVAFKRSTDSGATFGRLQVSQSILLSTYCSYISLSESFGSSRRMGCHWGLYFVVCCSIMHHAHSAFHRISDASCKGISAQLTMCCVC